MANVTVEQCDQRRANCPGTRVIPLKTLVVILLAMFAALIASHLMLSTSIAANSTSATGTKTEVKIRAEQQKTIETKLDAVLKSVNEIKGQISGKDTK